MKKSLLTILCTLMSMFAWAQGTTAGDGSVEPYAVLSDNQDVISQDATGVTYGKTLTFFYDTNKSSYREAYGVGPFDNGETGRGWHEMRTQITKVSFDSSFANCTALTSLAWWFSGMSNLVTIEGLANLNTSNVTDMWGMFEYCSSLSSLDLRTFDTRNVEKMAYMLDGCTSLQSLNISSFITSNVKEMGAMFQDCSSLPSLDVTGFDVQNNRSLWGTFAGLTVSTLDISSFNTAKVDDMGYMFARNPNLTTIYVGSGWTTASVAPSDVTGSVGGYDMFVGCTSLVGGAGTPYDANHVDETYAHIDGGTSNPGYFTDKNAAPVVDEDLKDDVYTVGESDFSTEFYTQFSKYYQIPQGGKWVSKFKLNLNPNDNRIYKNFVLLITNDEDRGAGQYKEYGAFRYDAVADSTRTNSQWGTSYVFPFQYTTSTLYLEPDENDMDPNVQKLGGLVTLTVDRSQADAFVITMSNEQGVVKTYRQPYVLPNFNNDSTNTNIRCFITVENSQLEFKGSNIEPIGGYSAPVATVEPYAVLKGDTLLTFYYDDQKSVRGGIAFLDGTDVNWPSSITSVTQAFFDSSFAEFSPTSTANWFNGFTSLTTITGLEFLNTANVTSMNRMFRSCLSLTSLNLRGLNTSNVTDMHQMFGNCRGLTSLDVSGINTANVTNMSGMFGGCRGLTSLDLSGFNTSNVTNMSEMFAELKGAQISLDLSSFNTSNVTDMSGMFVESSSLTSLDLSSFNTSNVTNMESMFADCSSLTTIYAGNEWSTEKVENGSGVFSGCTSIIGGAGTPYDSYHTDYTYAHIDGGENNPGYFTEKNASYNEAYAVLVSEDGGNMMYATLYYDSNKANHTEGFAVVGLDEMLQNQAWMQNRGSIQTITFDESFANCNPTNTSYWFAFCNSLTAINGLQYLNTEFVTNMEYMFHMCPALTSIDLSHFRAKSLTNMNSMFGGCSSLTSLDLSGFFTFTVTNMNYLFSGCTNLKTIYVNQYDWSTESVTAGDGVFENCTSLVGGAGTPYNDSHIDYTYARIDGGPNSTTPGYFTDKNAPITIAAPEFRFEGDNLTMTTETQDAGIFYKVADLPSMAEAVVDSVVNSLVVTADGQSTYYDQPFELKKAAVVKAIAVIRNETGTFASDVTTLVYDYEAWVNLKAAVSSGADLYGRAQGNPNVDTQLLEQLQWALNEGDMLYNDRAQMDSFEATHFTQRINELCAQIEAQMSTEDEPYAVLSDNNTKLTFFYDKKKSERGGMSVGPFNAETDRTWHYQRENITTAEFDPSFANCTSIISTAYWFYECKNMASILGIEYLKTDSVTNMSWMFSRCSNLTNLNVRYFNTANVTNMREMFYGCSGLTSLDLSAFNTANVTDMDGMFSECSGLTNLDLSGFNTVNVMNMYAMFNGCSGLITIDVSHFNTANVENMYGMFYGCSELTSLDISSFNTANVTIMNNMFRFCSGLKTIYAGSEWTTKAVTNAYEMFWGCTSLVGGAGTPYDANHVDYTYARIDGGPNSTTPGYFTDKNAPTGEATFDGLVAMVSGERTLDEAFEQHGGRAEAAKTIAVIVWNKDTALTNSDLQGITNPNLLIYVKADSLAPTNRNNIIVDGFAKNIVLTDLVQGNNNFYCPQNFTAEAISYTHEFKQQTQIGVSRGWETIALPFTVQTIMHEKRGVITPFGNSSSNTHFWLRRLGENGLYSPTMIEANTAYLISMPNSEEYDEMFNLNGKVTFSAENVVVSGDIVKDGSADYLMAPVFQRLRAQDNLYALNVNEERSGYPEGSVFEPNYRELRPFEALVEHKGSNPAPPRFIVGDLGGDTTGIEAMLVNSERDNSDTWYDLSGRKLQGKPAAKGVYIHHGKKKIIK